MQRVLHVLKPNSSHTALLWTHLPKMGVELPCLCASHVHPAYVIKNEYGGLYAALNVNYIIFISVFQNYWRSSVLQFWGFCVLCGIRTTYISMKKWNNSFPYPAHIKFSGACHSTFWKKIEKINNHCNSNTLRIRIRRLILLIN